MESDRGCVVSIERNSEPGFNDEDGEASKFYPERLRFNNSQRGREILFARETSRSF